MLPHLWLQAPGSLLRYMTHAHRTDFLEALFAAISRRKFKRSADLLAKKWADTLRYIGELALELRRAGTPAACSSASPVA